MWAATSVCETLTILQGSTQVYIPRAFADYIKPEITSFQISIASNVGAVYMIFTIVIKNSSYLMYKFLLLP